MDIVMVTGTLPLKEFKKERKLEYERLVKEGKLKDFLVEPPSDGQGGLSAAGAGMHPKGMMYRKYKCRGCMDAQERPSFGARGSGR